VSKKDKNQARKQRCAATRAILSQVLFELFELGPYVYTYARSTSSIYVKFKAPDLKSLTIRDHQGIPKYKYKWNVVIGYDGAKRVVDDGVVRYFYNERQLSEFYADIRGYHTKRGAYTASYGRVAQ
jgi:hypothetical protein